MPAVVKEPGLFTVAHGTLDRPEAFDYMIDSQKARSSFSVMETPILFIGHTHVPGVFELKKDAVKYYSAEHVPVRNKVKYIINVGSIGQPRDGDNRASYAILDRKKMSVNIRRVEYDIARHRRI
jgi:predicted phosphodiesterase